jgi:hypothetical protein
MAKRAWKKVLQYEEDGKKIKEELSSLNESGKIFSVSLLEFLYMLASDTLCSSR